MADTAQRHPLPLAYADPAFSACLRAAVAEQEVVQEFDRLYGASMATGNPPPIADMRAFATFVHSDIYMLLPADAIHSLRAPAGKGA